MRVEVENAENGFIVGYWKESDDFEGTRVQYVCGSLDAATEYLKKAFESNNGTK